MYQYVEIKGSDQSMIKAYNIIRMAILEDFMCIIILMSHVKSILAQNDLSK